MWRSFGIGVVALVVTEGLALGAPLAEDARAFGTREHVQSMVLSPSGAKVVMLTSGPGSETNVELFDIATGQRRLLLKSDGRPQSIKWCRFAGEIQLACAHSGVQPFGDLLVNFSRLVTIDTDGKAMRPLGTRNYFDHAFVRQSDGSIIDWLPGEQGAVLMARTYSPDRRSLGTILESTLEGLGVDRIDLKTVKVSRVEAPRSNADSYLTDGRGNVRLMTTSEMNRPANQLTGRVRIRYRQPGSRKWLDFGYYDDVSREGFRPLAIDADANSLYALRKTEGRAALYRVALDGSAAATLIASDKSVDIDDIVRVGPGQKVIGYTFADERRHIVYFDPEFERLQAEISKATPNQPLITFHGASADGQKLLVFASGATHAGSFYRFDRTTRKLQLLAVARPALQGKALAAMHHVRVTGSDGASIPAHVTIPHRSAGQRLPAVVLPHGGPEARDEWGFEWIPQFLAARGYAVIQPNFRGSSGYGDEWLADNGFRGWRTAIGDVTASARYLVDQGIADPSRLAILGWSYGGYAALQSVAVEPNLYKAAVAIAPLTDLGLMLKSVDGFSNERLASQYIGTGPHLVQGSPLRNSGAIRVPVLLVHGSRDANVALEHSERMLAALKANPTPAELLKFDKLDHQLDDSDARIRMLTKIGSFLDQAIGKASAHVAPLHLQARNGWRGLPETLDGGLLGSTESESAGK